MRILRSAEYRLPFYRDEACVDALRSVLRMDVSQIQLQYHAVYCLWVLTFEPEIAGSIDKGGMHIISELCQLVRMTKKEKVVRVCLATFKVGDVPTNFG